MVMVMVIIIVTMIMMMLLLLLYRPSDTSKLPSININIIVTTEMENPTMFI